MQIKVVMGHLILPASKQYFENFKAKDSVSILLHLLKQILFFKPLLDNKNCHQAAIILKISQRRPQYDSTKLKPLIYPFLDN